MPTSIEAQGLTVDEAIQHALNSLGVGRDRVEISIVHHPRSGFLGIGARRAKVRATLRERVMEDGEEFDMASGERRARGRRRRRTPRRRGGDRQRSDGGEGEDRKRQSEPQRSGERPQARDERRGRERGQRGQDAGDKQSSRGRERGQRSQDAGNQRSSRGRERGQRGQDADNQQSPRRDDSSQQQRSRRGGRGRRQSESAPREAASEAPAATSQAPVEEQAASSQLQPARQARTPLRTMTADEVRSRAQSVVTDMMKLMGIGAEIDTVIGPLDGEVTVNVKAEAEGLLIGRRGQTLDAVEHVVNRMVIPHDVAGDVRVSIDVGGYRDRRRESLLALAERLKERAVVERRRVQVSPMNARDRAIFEAALAGDDAVETRVLGSGVYRRLLLVPAGVDDDSPTVEAAASEDPGTSDRAAGAAPLAPQPSESTDPVPEVQDAPSVPASTETRVAGETQPVVPEPPSDQPSKDGD